MVPSLFLIALPLLYILSLLMVSLDLMLESPFFGALLFGLEDAFDFFNMLVDPLFGACLVYFHPVFGMLLRRF